MRIPIVSGSSSCSRDVGAQLVLAVAQLGEVQRHAGVVLSGDGRLRVARQVSVDLLPPGNGDRSQASRPRPDLEDYTVRNYVINLRTLLSKSFSLNNVVALRFFNLRAMSFIKNA